MTEIKEEIQTNEDNKENNQNKSLEPEKLPYIEPKYSRAIRKALKKIEDRKPKNLGSIFDSKRILVKKVKVKGDYSLGEDIFRKERNTFKEIEEYNVFSNEDKMIKGLMTQFKEKNRKDKIPKLIRRKMAFNKLYEITNQSDERLKNARKSKRLYTLEKYQENMLKAIDVNSIDQSEIMNLIQNLNDLKNDSNYMKSLPPINVNIIKDHVINSTKKEKRKLNFKEIMNPNNEPLDEFEKQEKIIKDIKSHKSPIKNKRNKNFDKLPEYIREAFSKNFHI